MQYSNTFADRKLHIESQVAKNPYNILKYPQADIDHWVTAICNAPDILSRVENPSFKLLIRLCVSNSYNMLKHYQYLLDYNLMLICVEHKWSGIRYIHNPTEEMQLVAVKQHPAALQYINDPSEHVVLASIKTFPESILNIKNSNITKEMIVLALDNHWDYYFYDRLRSKLNFDFIDKNHWFNHEIKKLKVKHGSMDCSLKSKFKYNV